MKALGLDVPLGRFQSYKDHGYVEDLESNARSVSPVCHFILGLLDKDGLKEAFGLCAVENPLLRLFFLDRTHVFYKRMGHDSTDLFLRAHEETHALKFLGKLGILERALEEQQGVCVNLRRLKSELSANIGGLYAVERKGLWRDFCFYSGFRPGINKMTSEAIDVYLAHQNRQQQNDIYPFNLPYEEQKKLLDAGLTELFY